MLVLHGCCCHELVLKCNLHVHVGEEMIKFFMAEILHYSSRKKLWETNYLLEPNELVHWKMGGCKLLIRQSDIKISLQNSDQHTILSKSDI